MKNVALTVLLLTCRFTYFNNSCTLDMLFPMLLAREKLYIYIYIYIYIKFFSYICMYVSWIFRTRHQFFVSCPLPMPPRECKVWDLVKHFQILKGAKWNLWKLEGLKWNYDIRTKMTRQRKIMQDNRNT
jgi:hypothetical protein